MENLEPIPFAGMVDINVLEEELQKELEKFYEWFENLLKQSNM